MRTFVDTLLLATVMVLLLSCGGRLQEGKMGWEEKSVEEILEEMRTDKAWIGKLDSLAQVSIGPGARCLDAVKHTFEWDGRLWVFNQDWGGVVEIPRGYVPADDPWQAELSFHGARIFSPDSLVLISVYAGYQPLELDEFMVEARNRFTSDSTFTVDVTRFDVSEITFRNGSTSPLILIETMTEDGIRGIARYVYSGPGEDRIEYNIFIQYPARMEDEMAPVREMVSRYPFGPDGSDPQEWY